MILAKKIGEFARFSCLAANFVLSPQSVRAEQSALRSPASSVQADSTNLLEAQTPGELSSFRVDAAQAPSSVDAILNSMALREELIPGDLGPRLSAYSRALQGSDGKSGFIKMLGEKFLESEKKNQPNLRPKVTDSSVKQVLDQALTLKTDVEKKLFDRSLSKETRFATLQKFVQDVLFPVRELLLMTFRQEDIPELLKRINAKRKSQGLPELSVFDPLEVYFPRLPDEIAPPGSTEEKILSDGPDPRAFLGLRIDDLGNRADRNDNCRNQRRLIFDFNPLTTLARDIQALSSAVTKENYMRGLKLMTMQMIIQQINLHNANLGIEALVKIPQGCRQAAAGMLPDAVRLPIPDIETRKAAMDAILASNGFFAGTPEYRDYYLDYVPADPEQGGFTGYLPFEHLRSAQRGLRTDRPTMVIADPNPMRGSERSRKLRDYLEPAFDDQIDFQSIFAFKRSQALSDLDPERAKKLKPLLEKMLAPAAEPLVFGEGDDARELHVEGYSTYIVEKMKAAQTFDWRDPAVVCPKARKELEKNQVNLPFPRIDGPDAARRWGLAEVWNFANFYKDVKNQSLQKTLHAGICEGHPSPRPKICRAAPGTNVNEFLANIASALRKYADDSIVLPKTPIDDEAVRVFYPSLVRLWESARKAGVLNKEGQRVSLLPAAIQSEWAYLNARMDYTPWASQRLAYIVAKNCGDLPQNEAERRSFEAVAFRLGTDSILAPDHGNRILRSDEKTLIWKKIQDDYSASNGHLFGAVAAGSRVDTFDRLEKLHRSEPLLTAEKAYLVARRSVPEGYPTVKKEIREIADYPESATGKMLQELYGLKNSLLTDSEKITKQERLLEKIAEKFGGLESVDNVKLRFLEIDSQYKRPIFHQIIKEASRKRRAQLLAQLEELCRMDTGKDTHEFKQLVRSTIHAQDELNQVLGIPELPLSVKNELDRWAKVDKDNMKIAGLQMAFFVGAAVLSSGCVAASSGLCAPVASAVMAAAATGTQLWIFKNSLEAAGEADETERLVKAWKDLGFTTDDAVDESREGHSYMIASLDAVFTLPLLGATAKSAQMGSRALVESRVGISRALGLGPSLQSLGKTSTGTAVKGSAKQSLRSVAHEVEVKASLYTLGFHSVADDLRKMGTHVLPALRRELLEPASVENLTESEVIRAFSKTLSQHYKNSPAELRKFFESYAGGRMQALEAKLARYETTYLQNNPGVLRSLISKTGFPASRMETLSKQLLFSRKMRDFVRELSLIEKNGGSLERFIEKNADNLREVLTNLPVRKREVPYHVLLQGSPMSFSSLPGLRQTLGTIEQSLEARKIAVAAENILFEVARKNAYQQLGLSPRVAIHSTYSIVSEFMELSRVEIAAAKNSKYAAKLDEFQAQVALRVSHFHREAKVGSGIPEGPELTRILFKPRNPVEKTMAETLWNSTPPSKLFKIEELEEPADFLVRRLSKYENLDQFEKFLTAMKVLTISKRPSVILN